jgi:hypothetical protein
MKCIKCIRQTKTYDLGEIRRTDDIDAEQKVKSGTFKYIPKTEWKGSKGSTKVEVANEINEQPAETTIAEKQLKSKKKKDDKAK